MENEAPKMIIVDDKTISLNEYKTRFATKTILGGIVAGTIAGLGYKEFEFKKNWKFVLVSAAVGGGVGLLLSLNKFDKLDKQNSR